MTRAVPADLVPADVVHSDGDPPADPFDLARSWLPADDEPERPRIALATIGEDGYPNVRTVLLSAFDSTGFAFHTAASSRKVTELAALPRASLVMLEPDFSRQLVVRGDVVPDAAAPAGAAWTARTEYLRRLAHLNTAEFAGLPLADRVGRWAALPLPSDTEPAGSWVGFRLRPVEITFWAGHAATASRRLQYLLRDDRWTVTRLPG